MEFINNLNPAYVPFLFILSLMAFIMYRAHVSSEQKFNIYDTLIDSTSGKASIEKIGIWMAMLSVSWWFFDKVAQRTASWEDVIAYGGLMGLAKFANKWLKTKSTKASE